MKQVQGTIKTRWKDRETPYEIEMGRETNAIHYAANFQSKMLEKKLEKHDKIMEIDAKSQPLSCTS